MAQAGVEVGPKIYVGDHNMSAATGSVPASSVRDASVASDAAIARAKLAKDSLIVQAIALTQWRKYDDLAVLLPATAAASYLGLYTGTPGTNGPLIRTEDLKAAGATNRYAGLLLQLPPEYEDDGLIKIRFHAGMVTTIAGVSATLDLEVFKPDEEGAVGSDLCTTTVQDINSVTFADFDFVITDTGLVRGDFLYLKATIAVNDAATGTAVIGAIGATKLLCDIRG